MVGIEGHNPSGHYLTASKIVDYLPLSVPDDGDFRQTKRQFVDQDNQLADSSDITSDLSLVCKLVIHENRGGKFDPLAYKWVDLVCVLSLTGKITK